LKPHEKHRALGPKKIEAVLVTVSTSRYRAREGAERFTDESGDMAEREMGRLGYRVIRRGLVPDDETLIRAEVNRFLSGTGDALVLMGGTGVSRRDVTIETVRPFFEKEIDGFGELLRNLSLRKIGAAAMLTRATAGVVGGKLVVCLPGSPDATRMGLRTIGKEFPHLLFVARS